MKTEEEIRKFLEELKEEQNMCMYHDRIWQAFESQINALAWVLR